MKKIILFVLMFFALACMVSAATVIIQPANPVAGDQLDCTVVGGTSSYYYYYWFRNNVYQSSYQQHNIPAGITLAGETWRCDVYIPGNYYVGQAYASISAAPLALSATCNATPTTGAAPLNVLFSATALGGSGVYTYAWNFDDGTAGTGATNAHTYTVPAIYNSFLTIMDGTGASVVANCPAVTVTSGTHTLTVAFSYTPLAPAVNEVITFDGSASVDSLGHPLTYSWNFGDGITQSSGNSPIITHSYIAPGTYPVTLTVSDGPYGLTAYITHNVVVTGILNITNINCFRTVIEGQNQSCQITVTTNNLPAQNVDVDVYFLDGTPFASCTTTLAGACTVYRTMPVGSAGTYTVYATAVAPGYINDTDTYPRYTFDVWARQYDIINLATYNDSAFHNLDGVFYRGEALYVKFQVYDVTNHVFVTEDIVTAASLVSLPGGRADLTEMTFNDNWYYYRLDMIPLTHAFLGDSNVFAFAFNFTGQTGGQAQVNLTILNNVPTISPIADININVGQIYNLDLTPYGYDLEDQRNLVWTVTENSAYFDAQITNLGYSNLEVTGIAVGSGTLTLRAYDLDNDYDEIIVIVNVGTSGNGTYYVCSAVPTSGNIPLDVTFTITQLGSTNTAFTVGWDFGDGTTGAGIQTRHRYTTAGTYIPAAIITDVNSVQTILCPAIRAFSGNTTLNADAGGPYNGYMNEPLTFDASGSTGAIIAYEWNFGDGSVIRTTTPTFDYTYFNKIGRYTITLTVFDANGNTATDTTTALIIERVYQKPADIEKDTEGLYIGRILLDGIDRKGEILRSDDELTIEVNMENFYSYKLEDVKMTAEIFELGIKQKTSAFDLRKGQEATKTLTLPIYDAPAGTYYLKITVGNEDVKRIKYREIIVR